MWLMLSRDSASLEELATWGVVDHIAAGLDDVWVYVHALLSSTLVGALERTRPVPYQEDASPAEAAPADVTSAEVTSAEAPSAEAWSAVPETSAEAAVPSALPSALPSTLPSTSLLTVDSSAMTAAGLDTRDVFRSAAPPASWLRRLAALTEAAERLAQVRELMIRLPSACI